MRDFFASYQWNDLCISDKNASEFADAFNEAIQKGLENYVSLKLKSMDHHDLIVKYQIWMNI